MLFGSIFTKNIFASWPRIYDLKGKSHVKGGRDRATTQAQHYIFKAGKKIMAYPM